MYSILSVLDFAGLLLGGGEDGLGCGFGGGFFGVAAGFLECSLKRAASGWSSSYFRRVYRTRFGCGRPMARAMRRQTSLSASWRLATRWRAIWTMCGPLLLGKLLAIGGTVEAFLVRGGESGSRRNRETCGGAGRRDRHNAGRLIALLALVPLDGFGGNGKTFADFLDGQHRVAIFGGFLNFDRKRVGEEFNQGGKIGSAEDFSGNHVIDMLRTG